VPSFCRAASICWVVLCCPLPALADELPCQLDDALSQAAADLLLAGSALDAPQLTAAVREAGSDATALHALTVQAGNNAELKRWLSELRARTDAELVCGEAASESRRLLIATAQGGTLSPIDPQARVVRGRLAKGFTQAELVIAADDGSLTRLGASAEVLARGIALAPELPTPIHVQLVARGPAGPRPIAERTIESSSALERTRAASSAAAVHTPEPNDAAMAHTPAANGASAPSTPASGSAAAPAQAAPGSADPSANELAGLLLELRRSRGRPSLRDNRLLRGAATEHARAVCREGRVAHELSTGNGPEARLASVGLTARLVGEAIARAADAGTAFNALEQSPSHLLTLIEPRFTDVGVGQASDGHGKSCFVVLLCAWPRYKGR
jgi:uncharacterized protein YkwD